MSQRGIGIQIHGAWRALSGECGIAACSRGSGARPCGVAPVRATGVGGVEILLRRETVKMEAGIVARGRKVDRFRGAASGEGIADQVEFPWGIEVLVMEKFPPIVVEMFWVRFTVSHERL